LHCFAVADPSTSRSLTNSVAASKFPSGKLYKDNELKRPKSLLSQYSKMSSSARSEFKANSPVHNHPMVSCFTLEKLGLHARSATILVYCVVKRSCHGKLKLANSCWQTQVGVCERRKNSRQTHFISRQQFANVFFDCFCAFHTHQLEFANTCLPTFVYRVKAA